MQANFLHAKKNLCMTSALSHADLLLFTATANLSIVSLNLSLMLNRVGFYQVCCRIPHPIFSQLHSWMKAHLPVRLLLHCEPCEALCVYGLPRATSQRMLDLRLASQGDRTDSFSW